MFKPEKVNLDVKNLKYRYVDGKLFNTNGHDFVEIAGIKWATMNVGANKVTDTGLYFQWGDTQGYTADQIGKKEDGKKPFASNWSDYKFTSDGGKTFSKYNSAGMTLALEDDPVHAAWGGDWRMPTQKEISLLIDASIVTQNWTSGYNGTNVAGYEFHDSTSGRTLFLPACGAASDGSVTDINITGLYWMPLLDAPSNAKMLYISNNGTRVVYGVRFLGFSIRGVLEDKALRNILDEEQDE